MCPFHLQRPLVGHIEAQVFCPIFPESHMFCRGAEHQACLFLSTQSALGSFYYFLTNFARRYLRCRSRSFAYVKKISA